MKRIKISIVILVILSGCKTKDPELLGTWFEQTDSNRSGILIFDKDSVRFPYDFNGGGNISYSIRGDKITFHLFDVVKKYSVDQDTLKLIDPKNDSIVFTYYKRGSFNIHDFVNYRYGVQLSEIEHAPINSWHSDDNIIVLKSKQDNVMDLQINGTSYNLDNELYSKIMIKESPNIIENYLFADKKLPLKTLKLLEAELFKAQHRQIKYIVYHNDSLNSIGCRLPRIDYDFPDSILKKPPVFPGFSFDYDKDLLCEISLHDIRLNRVLVSFDSLRLKINEDFSNGTKSTLVINFDPNLEYSDYLKKVNDLRRIYYSLWDSYAFEKYKISNYTKKYLKKYPINQEVKKAVHDHYPIRIVEIIDKRKLNAIKNKIAL